MDKKRSDKFYQQDFMYYDAVDRELVWLYALSDFDRYSEKYDVIDFKGGLYAASISRDGDDLDGERVVSQIKEWITQTKYFEVDESIERPLLFHVTTTDLAYEKMKYRQLDLYVPIK